MIGITRDQPSSIKIWFPVAAGGTAFMNLDLAKRRSSAKRSRCVNLFFGDLNTSTTLIPGRLEIAASEDLHGVSSR